MTYPHRMLFVILIIFGFSTAQAAFSPVAVAIIPPIQFPPSDFDITGLRLSALFGSHRSVHGLDFAAIGNITEINFVGLGVSGIFNMTKGTTTAIGGQIAGITNMNSQKTSVYGLQLAGAVNSNTASATIVGLQVALMANLSAFSTIYGAQVGIYNKAQDVYGFQIGLVNDAQSLHGIQIGLVNFNHTGLFKVSPILNIGF